MRVSQDSCSIQSYIDATLPKRFVNGSSTTPQKTFQLFVYGSSTTPQPTFQLFVYGSSTKPQQTLSYVPIASTNRSRPFHMFKSHLPVPNYDRHIHVSLSHLPVPTPQQTFSYVPIASPSHNRPFRMSLSHLPAAGESSTPAIVPRYSQSRRHATPPTLEHQQNVI